MPCESAVFEEESRNSQAAICEVVAFALVNLTNAWRSRMLVPADMALIVIGQDLKSISQPHFVEPSDLFDRHKPWRFHTRNSYTASTHRKYEACACQITG